MKPKSKIFQIPDLCTLYDWRHSPEWQRMDRIYASVEELKRQYAKKAIKILMKELDVLNPLERISLLHVAGDLAYEVVFALIEPEHKLRQKMEKKEQ